MIQQTNNIPAIYTEAAETIKTAILQGQYEALKGENRIQLAVYYSVGKYVSQIHERANGELVRLQA